MMINRTIKHIRLKALSAFLVYFAVFSINDSTLRAADVPPPAYLTVIPTPQRERYEDRVHPVSRVTVRGDVDARVTDDLLNHFKSLTVPVSEEDADLVVNLSVAEKPDHPKPKNAEGYRLTIQRQNNVTHADVVANGPLGLSHGVQSLKQLTMRWKDQVIVREAAIVDWPVTRFRFVKRSSGYWLQQGRRYKMNGGSQQLALDANGTLPQTDKVLKAMADRGNAEMMGMLAMVNMGNVYRGGEEDVQRVVQQYRRLSRAGCTHLAIMNDDRMTRLDAQAHARFDSYTDAQMHYLKQIAEAIGTKPDSPRLTFMPNNYYSKKKMYEPYANGIAGRVPSQVSLFWAGTGTPGQVVTAEHLRTVRDQVRVPKLWFYANWPQVGKPYFLADNFNAVRHRDFGRGELVELVTVSTTTYPRPMPVSFITMCDLLWNPEAYDPARSLRRATAQVVDPESFDAFYQFFGHVDRVSGIKKPSQRGPMYGADNPKERREKVVEITKQLDSLIPPCLATPTGQKPQVKRVLESMLGRRQSHLDRLARNEAIEVGGGRPPKSIDCPLVDTAPTLDGKLDDDVWSKAALVDGFTDLRATKAAPHQTRVRVLRTSDAIYLGVTANETVMSDPLLADPGRKYPVAIAEQSDAFLWWADGVEVFFDPHRDRREIYQVILNPWGMKECFRYTSDKYGYYQIRDQRRTNWPVRGSVSRGPNGWAIECAFPLSMFEEKVEGTWGFNVARNRRLTSGNGMKYSIWSPLGWGFQDASRFGRLNLE